MPYLFDMKMSLKVLNKHGISFTNGTGYVETHIHKLDKVRDSAHLLKFMIAAPG